MNVLKVKNIRKLDTLLNDFDEAKKAENTYKALRLKAEEKITEFLEELTDMDRTAAGAYRVKGTNLQLNITIVETTKIDDVDALRAEIPEEASSVFVPTFTFSKSALNNLKKAKGAASAIIQKVESLLVKYTTSKIGKPTFSVTAVED